MPKSKRRKSPVAGASVPPELVDETAASSPSEAIATPETDTSSDLPTNATFETASEPLVSSSAKFEAKPLTESASSLPTAVSATDGPLLPNAIPNSGVPFAAISEPRPLIADQKQRSVAGASPRPTKEPKEWFARLRIREDRLARLWVTNLMGRDVVVWSPKEKRWVALLSVPELRHAIKTAELERANSPRSVARRPSTVVPARLSQPPAMLPPEPPPPLALTHTSSAGELRLQSIAQGAARSSQMSEEIDAPRPSVPSFPPSYLSAASSYPRSYSVPPLAAFNRQGWKWRAFERVVWLMAGVLLVVAFSGVGANDEQSSYFEPAAVELAGDEREQPRSLGEWFTGPTEQTRAPGVDGATGIADSNCAGTSAEQPNSGHESLSRAVPATVPVSRSPSLLREDSGRDEQNASSQSDFDLTTARVALVSAANNARNCPGNSIRGRVVVTFAPSGAARSVDIPLLIGDGVDRDCIARAFKGVRVPPFTGGAVAVKKEF